MARAIHERTLLRRAIVAALADLTATYYPADGEAETFGVTVLDAPTIDMWIADLPAVAVYVVSESSEDRNLDGPGNLDRTAQVQINIAAQSADDLHARLDAIALAVELLLESDTDLGGGWSVTGLRSSQIGRAEDARMPAAFLTLTYEAEFQTDPKED